MTTTQTGPTQGQASVIKVLVTGDGGRCYVHGRAAQLILQIARHAERINALAVGKLIANLAHAQVKLELQESLPTIGLPAAALWTSASTDDAITLMSEADGPPSHLDGGEEHTG